MRNIGHSMKKGDTSFFFMISLQIMNYLPSYSCIFKKAQYIANKKQKACS